MLRIVIAEPDEALGLWLADVIAPAQGFEVVGTALDGDSALDMVLRTHPDVVVVDLDIVMPPRGGLTLVEAITAAMPGTIVLVLAADVLEEAAQAALAAGATGVLAKDGSAQFPADLWSDSEEGRATRSLPRTGHQENGASEMAHAAQALPFPPWGAPLVADEHTLLTRRWTPIVWPGPASSLGMTVLSPPCCVD